MNEHTPGEVLDASPLFFGDIRFVRDIITATLDVTGPIDGFGQCLRYAISIPEREVAIAKARGKATVIDNRLTLAAAIDRAEHLQTIHDCYYS